MRSVNYVDRAGVARVAIAVTGAATPQVVESGARRAVLVIPGTDIGDALERTLDTSQFAGPVRSVSSFRDGKEPGTVRVVVALDEPTESTLARQGDTYYWDFAKPAAAGAGAGAGAAPRAASYPAPVVAAYGAASTPITNQTVSQVAGKKRKVYRGRKIDLDFKDADIHNLLRLLADVGGVNIVVPDEIKARGSRFACATCRGIRPWR